MPAPPITQVAGTWSGTLTQSDGNGTLSLDLTQSQKKIGGSFDATTGNESPSGPLTGKISGDNLTLTLHDTNPDDHGCTIAVMATVDDDTMSGTFLLKGNKKHCTGKGTFDLEKQ